MTAARPARTTQLAQIHLGKKQLGLDEETYRAMLFTVTGKRSAGELDIAGRQRVIAHMISRGAKLGFTGKAGRNLSPQEKKLHALWWRAHKSGAVQDASERALRRWVARQANGVEDASWLNPHQLSGLIEALKSMIARAEAARR